MNLNPEVNQLGKNSEDGRKNINFSKKNGIILLKGGEINNEVKKLPELVDEEKKSKGIADYPADVESAAAASSGDI